jgi:hypothetical protein
MQPRAKRFLLNIFTTALRSNRRQPSNNLIKHQPLPARYQYYSSAFIMSPYHDSHVKPNGPGDARPTALQIIEDEGLIGKLGDRVMLVTGASSGIGIETAAALHATGATVFATARDVAKGQKVIDKILAKDPSNKAPIHLIKVELDSLDSVKAGAAEILKKTDKMNIVINNAGVS